DVDDTPRKRSIENSNRRSARAKRSGVFAAGALALTALIVGVGIHQAETGDDVRTAAGSAGKHIAVARLAPSPQIPNRPSNLPEGAVLARAGEFPVSDDMPTMAESLGLVPEERPPGRLVLLSAER